MSFRPLGDRVIIRREKKLEKTASGIYIPETSATIPNQGEIVSVGPGLRDATGEIRSLDVKPGDRVTYSFHANYEQIVDNGETLVVIRAGDILGINQ